MTEFTTKGALRKAMVNSRVARDFAGDAARTCALKAALSEFSGTIACYVSIDNEPDTIELISWMAARGQVLLPVLRREPDWAMFTSWQEMRPAWRGIPEPTSPRLGKEALVQADLVLCPGLALGWDGSRLGTGGGWYDRALPYRRPEVEVWCLVRHAEIIDSVPTEGHDLRVDAAATERGITYLAR